MMKNTGLMRLLFMILGCVTGVACDSAEERREGDGGSEGDGDADTDGDGDGDADTDGDADADGDTDGDADADGDADGDGDTDPDTGTGGTDDFGCAVTGGGTRDGYYTFQLTICGDDYNVQTNPWGGADQTITAGGDSVFRVDRMQEPAGREEWEVATFPSVYRGTSYGGDRSTDSGLPIAIRDITSVRTGLSSNASAVSYGGNTTYDVYFSNNQSYNGGAPDTYLMVWFDANALNPINGDDEGWSCRSTPPTYIDSCSDAGSVTVGGKTFYRFMGSNGESPVISYAPETTFDTWEFDLKDFIDDAVSVGALTSGMYLQGIQAGFELTTGGVGLTVGGFYATINE